ncbi:gamma-interferon-inducible lysosomal thiol reductase-like isoform X2 [Belonocnema kinseyi]|uniref:gamma-interferon-inducible lysosomal thiol reductase-like isoform X2 n=1 Tax=Belonocnema kinseyi TaxID=2817044 RepID=UPI00143DD78B|nr:gamma-interferon-inducible lysosomal thiol reductase-like isoform X2 [Belonocnema kinseyi]
MKCYQVSIAKIVSLASIFIQIVSADQSTRQSKTIINVELYYEALCPYSKEFVKMQIIPTYRDLKDHISISFIPYGLATHRRAIDGSWKFDSQHGQRESDGNMAQACGIHEIETSVEPEKQQQQLVDFVGCVMSDDDPPSAANDCAQKIGLTEESKNRIKECQKTPIGCDLLASYGDKTRALKPKLLHVPTVVINGVYSKENNHASLICFHKFICDIIPVEDTPAICKLSWSTYRG